MPTNTNSGKAAGSKKRKLAENSESSSEPTKPPTPSGNDPPDPPSSVAVPTAAALAIDAAAADMFGDKEDEDEDQETAAPPPPPPAAVATAAAAAEAENARAAAAPEQNLLNDVVMNGTESSERPIICSDWKEHIESTLAPQSNKMFKELIVKRMHPMLVMLNILIQHETTQAARRQPVTLDKDGKQIPFVSTKNRLKPSITASKETSDDPEMIALVKKAAEEDLADQQHRTKNNDAKATLKIKYLLTNLRTLIYGLIIDIIMKIVMRRNEFAKTRSKRLTQGNAELALNDEDVSDVIARKVILQFQNDDEVYLGKTSTQDLLDEFLDIRKYGPKATIIESKLQAEGSGVTAKFTC